MNWSHLLYKLLGSSGRCLGSKSGYRMDHPKHVVFFNALVYVNKQRVWCGDLDLTLDEAYFLRLSRLHPNAEIMILSENFERVGGFSGDPTFNDFILLLEDGVSQINNNRSYQYKRVKGALYET